MVLHLKFMSIRKISNFPFPTPPEADQVNRAEERLKRLGALAIKDGEVSLKLASNIFVITIGRLIYYSVRQKTSIVSVGSSFLESSLHVDSKQRSLVCG
jgi:hypothetical protein